MKGRVVLLVVIVLALVVILRLDQGREGPLKVSGFVEADEVRVGSRVGGRVRSVAVEEGDVVQTGDVLVELEPYDLEERLAEARGKVSARGADLRRLEAGYRPEEIAKAQAHHDQLAAQLAELVAGPRTQEVETGRARVTLAEAELELAQVEHERAERLTASETMSLEQRDRATRNLKVAQANLEVRKLELALLEEGTRQEQIARARAQVAEAEAEWELLRNGYRAEDIEAARAELTAAEAARDAIEHQLRELAVHAPLDGVVEAVELVPGDLVAAGAPILSLLDPGELWVRAYVPENRLAVQVSQQVSVTVDSFPDTRFKGRVTFISREAEFTPGNVQTPEERSKQVFRIKVTLEEGQDRLRPGMAADVWLEDGDGS